MGDFMGVDRNITTGALLEAIDKLKETGSVVEGFFSPYDPEVLKYVFLEMLEQEDVDLLLHTWVVDVIVSNSRINGLSSKTSQEDKQQ